MGIKSILASIVAIVCLASCTPPRPPLRMMTLDLPPSQLGQDLRLILPDPSAVDPDAFVTAVVKAMSEKQLFVHAVEHYPIGRSPMQSSYRSKVNHILLVYASRPIDGAVNTLFLAFSDKTGETATLVRAECYVNLRSEQPCTGVLIPVPRREGSQRLRKGPITPEECKVFTRQFLKTGRIEDLITIWSRGIPAFEESQVLEEINYRNVKTIIYSRYSDIGTGMRGCSLPLAEIIDGR